MKIFFRILSLAILFSLNGHSAIDRISQTQATEGNYIQDIQSLASRLSRIYTENQNNPSELLKHTFPLTQQTINHSLAIQVHAFKKAAEEILLTKPKSRSHLKAFNVQLEKLLNQYTEKTDLPLKLFHWKNAQKQIIGLQQTLWVQFIKALNADKIELSSNLNLILYNAFIKALEHNQSWEPLHETLSARLNQRNATLKTSIIPIKQTNNIFKEIYDADKINGVSSFAKEQTEHAVNAAFTELYIDNTLAYRGIRTGVLSEPCVIDSKIRATGALNKGHEILTLALDAYLRKIESPEIHVGLMLENAQESGTPIEFPISSISLLTPIKKPLPEPYANPKSITLNYQQPKLPRISEFYQLQDQVETWHQIASENTTVKIVWNNKHYTVKVKPTVYLFNFGVNAHALKNDSNIFVQSDGGWSYANSINEPSLTAILGNLDPEQPLGGFVDGYLKNNNYSTVQKELVRTLANQIRTIWSDQSYMLKTDPYKLPLRVTLLMHYLGHITVFNCMSGKDRTGMLDCMIKFWLTYYHFTEKAFEPNTSFSNEEKLLFTAITLLGNNLPYQAYNMSIGGSRVYFDGIDPLLAYFISPTARLWYQGGAQIFRGSE